MERLRVAVRVLQASDHEGVASLAQGLLHKGTQRLAGDSLDKRYINVAAGDSRTALAIGDTIVALQQAGFTGPDRLKIVPGPLFRSTHHGDGVHTNMPLSASATYLPLHQLL